MLYYVWVVILLVLMLLLRHLSYPWCYRDHVTALAAAKSAAGHIRARWYFVVRRSVLRLQSYELWCHVGSFWRFGEIFCLHCRSKRREQSGQISTYYGEETEIWKVVWESVLRRALLLMGNRKRGRAWRSEETPRLPIHFLIGKSPFHYFWI